MIDLVVGSGPEWKAGRGVCVNGAGHRGGEGGVCIVVSHQRFRAFLAVFSLCLFLLFIFSFLGVSFSLFFSSLV